jgi:hypothetical protein
MNNIYNDEVEKEDDWGWFIQLDLNNTRPTTNTNVKTKHIYQNLQTIDENKEYYDINFKPNSNPTPTTNPNKNTFMTFKTKYDFFKKLLFYGLLYNCIYLDQIYKCINPFSCYKQKISN